MFVREVVLLARPECHLCDDAHTVICSVLEQEHFSHIKFRKMNILDDPKLYSRYWEFIPVVLIDGAEFATWRLDREAFEQALMS